MQMSGRATSCCVVLVVTLACASAVQTLNSISDLKTIRFGSSVPKHCLILLHWFANIIEIDNNNDVIRLTFDPNSEYGSHHYGNYEMILDPLRRGNRYYTIGNLNLDTSAQLPDYVRWPWGDHDGENRDRLIVSVSGQRIVRVFITQHEAWPQQGTLYDPNHTYEITTGLLRQIREFSIRDDHLPLLHLRNRYRSNVDIEYLKQTWGNLAYLVLFLTIVIGELPRHQGSNTFNTARHLPTYTLQNQNWLPPMRSEYTRREYSPSNDTNTQANDLNLKLCIVILLFFIFFIFISVISVHK